MSATEEHDGLCIFLELVLRMYVMSGCSFLVDDSTAEFQGA